MATFLELSQEARRLSGIGGTGPTSVTAATGIELRIVNYVKNAWLDIQTHPKKWKWMWSYNSPSNSPTQTIINTTLYTRGDLESIIPYTCMSYLTATGVSDRQRMTYMPWATFMKKYGTQWDVTGTIGTASRPRIITKQPGLTEFVVYPKPDAVYSIEFQYFIQPQVLSANSDTPQMPSQFHELIVYEALKRFGKAEDAPEIIKLGEEAAGSDGSENRPVSGLWRTLIWSQEWRDTTMQGEDEHMTVRTNLDVRGY